jgi:hypothetical protein
MSSCLCVEIKFYSFKKSKFLQHQDISIIHDVVDEAEKKQEINAKRFLLCSSSQNIYTTIHV